MRTLILVLIIGFSTVLFAQYVPVEPITLDAASTLSLSATYIEKQLSNTFETIEVISNIPDVQKGKWEVIQQYLEPLCKSLPATYFFANAKGDYYTTQDGFTNLSLHGKEYFQTCIVSDKKVEAYSEYNRLTGKKSLVYATPIVVKNKNIGMIGFTLDLETYSKELDKVFSLPENFTWFAINEEGKYFLHQNEDLVFTDALQEDSDTMRNELTYALQNENGAILYDYNNAQREGLFVKMKNLNWWLIFSKINEDQILEMPLLSVSLENIKLQLEKIFDNANIVMNEQTERYSPNVKNIDSIRSMLNTILESSKLYSNVIYTDKSGKMLAIEPVDYVNFEKKPIYSNEFLRPMAKDFKPYFSNVFKSMDNRNMFMIAYPFLNRGKHFGAFEIFMRPDIIVESITKKMNFSEFDKLWIIQLDGTVVYYDDCSKIGRNMKSDQIFYKEDIRLPMLDEIISKEKSVQPLRISQGQSTIHLEWDTIEVYNKTWRIVLTKSM